MGSLALRHKPFRYTCLSNVRYLLTMPLNSGRRQRRNAADNQHLQGKNQTHKSRKNSILRPLRKSFPWQEFTIIQMIEFPQQGQNMLTPPHGYLASQLPNHALKAVDDQIITLFFHGKENFPDLRPLPLQWFLGIHKPGKGEGSPAPAFRNAAVGVNAAVTEKGPDAAVVFQCVQVKVRVQDGFIADGSLRHNLAIVVRHKGLPPERLSPSVPTRLTAQT